MGRGWRSKQCFVGYGGYVRHLSHGHVCSSASMKSALVSHLVRVEHVAHMARIQCIIVLLPHRCSPIKHIA
jgi:hypothetical protein